MELDLVGLLEGNVSTRDAGPDSGPRRMSGVVAAVITNVTDRKNLARVKVTFTFAGRVESAWARVAVPWAGDRRGAYFVPEVDDEVLIAFRDGDLRHPYVLGYLWSDPSVRPPEPDPAARRSVLRSRSGHRVVFDEGEGREAVRVESAKGHRLVLADGPGDAVDIELRVADSSVHVTLDGAKKTVDVRAGNAGGTIRLSAPGGRVTVEAQTIDLTATGAITLDAQTVSIKGHNMVEIN